MFIYNCDYWYYVPGYDRLWAINQKGDIINASTKSYRKPHLNKDGYLRITLYKKDNTHYKNYLIHKLVAELFIGERPIGYEINHIDGNKLNNSMFNLEYTTKSLNRLHMYSVCQRKARGKTTNPETVREIIKLYKEGLAQQKIADRLNLSRSTVKSILVRSGEYKIGKSWGDVH